MTPASCLPHDCFCEAVGSGWIKQPSNTWSCVAFVLVGLWAWTRGGRLYGVLMVFMGVASAAFHGSLTLVGQWLDNVAMYLLPTYVAARNLAELGVRGTQLLLLGANAAAAGAAWFVPETRRWLFAGLIGALLVTEIVRHVKRGGGGARWIAAAVVTLGVAYGAWTLDRRGIWCDPTSWLQGHAVWHTLCAVAGGFLWLAVERRAGLPRR